MGKGSTRYPADLDSLLASPTAFRFIEQGSRKRRQRRPCRIRQPADPRNLAIGFSIRRRAEAMGIAVGALAHHFGVSNALMEDYLQGYQPMGFSLLVGFARRFNCRVADLIGDIDDGVAQVGFRDDGGHLRVDGAERLLKAYAAIPPDLRKPIVQLVAVLANERRTRPAP